MHVIKSSLKFISIKTYVLFLRFNDYFSVLIPQNLQLPVAIHMYMQSYRFISYRVCLFVKTNSGFFFEN